MFRRLSCSLVLTLSLVFPNISEADPIDFSDRSYSMQDVKMERYRKQLHRQLNACNAAALVQVASFAEVQRCSRIYSALKLSFLQGVTPERYAQMTPKTRAIANRKGYAALLAWRRGQHAHLHID